MILTNLPEKIEQIKVIDNDGDYIGYRIVTDQRTIDILISNHDQCCESWGYLTDNEQSDFSYWIESTLENIELIDKDKCSIRMKKEFEDLQSSEVEAIFVNVNTDRGKLQFSVYNSHNGYYGHPVIVRDNVNIIYQGSC